MRIMLFALLSGLTWLGFATPVAAVEPASAYLEYCQLATDAVVGTRSITTFDDARKVGQCLGFIDGAREGMGAVSIFVGHSLDCMGDDVTRGDVAKVFVRYLQTHPSQLGDNVFLLFQDAIKDAYPCRQ